LTPASGRQDHTTSPSASAPFVIGASTSTASCPASVTIANRPSVGQDGREYTNDLAFRKIRIFLRKGLDRRTGKARSTSLICPSGNQCRATFGDPREHFGRSPDVIAGLDPAVHLLTTRYYGANATRNLTGISYVSVFKETKQETKPASQISWRERQCQRRSFLPALQHWNWRGGGWRKSKRRFLRVGHQEL
jgi:hypothetical protein